MSAGTDVLCLSTARPLASDTSWSLIADLIQSVGGRLASGLAILPREPMQEASSWQFSFLTRSTRCFSSSRRSNALRTSDWLEAGSSGGGSYPPLNVFRKGDDVVIVTEVPGVQKADLRIEAKGNTIRIAEPRTSRSARERASIVWNPRRALRSNREPAHRDRRRRNQGRVP